MRRKKSKGLRGLGGSESEHKRKFKTYAADAFDGFEETIKYANQGNCPLALDWYEDGVVTDGKASAHAFEAVEMGAPESMLEGPIVRKLEAASAKAKSALRQHCIVGGGLSGMRRRRRR